MKKPPFKKGSLWMHPHRNEPGKVIARGRAKGQSLVILGYSDGTTYTAWPERCTPYVEPTGPRRELSYDGFGINGPDEYRSRLATFAANVDDVTRNRYGNLWESAPDLLAFVDMIARFINTDNGDDSIETVNSLISRARALSKRARGES